MTQAIEDSLIQIRKAGGGGAEAFDFRLDLPDEGRLLPPQAFSSSEVFDAEMRHIFDGVERGEEEIFPDPLSQSMAETWRSGAAKALERENAALLQAQPAAS